jgi:hypothetical protein
MTATRQVGLEQTYSSGVQSLGAVLRCVRRRCAPAHSAAHGPQRLAGTNGECLVIDRPIANASGNCNCR